MELDFFRFLILLTHDVQTQTELEKEEDCRNWPRLTDVQTQGCKGQVGCEGGGELPSLVGEVATVTVVAHADTHITTWGSSTRPDLINCLRGCEPPMRLATHALPAAGAARLRETDAEFLVIS